MTEVKTVSLTFRLLHQKCELSNNSNIPKMHSTYVGYKRNQ